MQGFLIFLAIIGVGVAGLIFWAITTYNTLVRRRNVVQEAWSVVETHLKQRANLVPNLVEIVKGYAAHEKETLDQVTALRAQSMEDQGIQDRSQTERRFSSMLGQLRVAVEAYPDLKANENFLNLQEQLDEIEDSIQMSRRYYNGTVRNLNILIDSFPSNLIANQFQFQKAQFFEIEDAADRTVPKVSFN